MTRDTPTDTKSTTASGRTDDRTDESSTMGAIDHTHPHRNTTFGSIFGRGPSIAADGGEPAPTAAAEDEPAMEDVDHDAPSETGPNATFERGAEHADADPADTDDPAAVEDPADVTDPVEDGARTNE